MTNRGSSTGGSSPRSVHSSSRRRKSRNRRSHPRSRSRSSSYSQSRSRSRSISRSSSFRSRSRSRSRRRWSGSRSHSRSRYARHSRSGSRSSSYDRRRSSRRSRSRSQFSTRSHSAERSLSPVNEKGRDPRDRSKRVAWRNSVYIVGEKAKDITFHYCEVCDLPIVLYGRLLPCKHVLCYTCASSLPNGKCNRCQKPVKTVDRFQIGRIFMCSKSDGCCRTYLSQRDLQAHIIHRHRDGSTAPANATTAEKTEVTQCTSQGEITRPSAPIQSVPLTTFNPIGFAATNRAPGLLPMPPQGSTTPLTNPISVPHLVRPPPTSASIPILQFTSPPPSSQAPPIDPMSLPPLGIMNTSIPPPTGPAAPVLNSANPLALLAAAVSQTKPPGLNIPPPANANTNPNWSQPTMMNNIRLSGTLPTNNPGQLNRGRFPSHCKYLP